MQFQAALAVDTNADGNGEYGFLGELAGAVPVREYSPNGGVVGSHPINPPVLATALGNVQDDGSGHGAIERAGNYKFTIGCYIQNREVL